MRVRGWVFHRYRKRNNSSANSKLNIHHSELPVFFFKNPAVRVQVLFLSIDHQGFFNHLFCFVDSPLHEKGVGEIVHDVGIPRRPLEGPAKKNLGSAVIAVLVAEIPQVEMGDHPFITLSGGLQVLLLRQIREALLFVNHTEVVVLLRRQRVFKDDDLGYRAGADETEKQSKGGRQR